MAVVVLTNAIAAFALVRMFSLIFAGEPHAMTTRAPEPIWLIIVPMTTLAGLTLNLPAVIRNLSLFPADLQLSWWLGSLLFLSSVAGIAIASAFYIFRKVESPATLLPTQLNNLLAYDFYTPRVYQLTAIGFVDNLSKFTDWVDRYVIDGLVNLVGLTSILSGETLKRANTGQMQLYILTITFFVALISLYLGWLAFVA